MLETNIDDFIINTLSEDAQKNALEFVAFLEANEMLFERGEGYWKDKLYWVIKYKKEHVCFILMNGAEDESENEGWTIWSDDSDSNCFADFPLDEHLREIAWENVDICANCGSCNNPGGTMKRVFGKEFNHVCITTMKFINPDSDALKCVKKIVELRKNGILSDI